MQTNEDKINKINKLFEKHDVEKRKHASTMATILGIHYNSAKLKLDNKRGIRNEEIKALYEHFNEPLIEKNEGKGFNGVYITNKTHQRCRVVTQDKPATEINVSNFYAVKKDGFHIISVPPAEDRDKPLYKVTAIEFLPAPRVAILDNDLDILSLTQKTLKKYGIESDCYETGEELEEALNNKKYDAFIVDWLLDYGKTSESVIKNVSNDTIIILLTGQLDHYENNISKVLLEHNNVQLIEKPARPIVILSPLIANLFFI
ncbi:UNVERIFIED_ORG: BetR domain-containing protein [Citrobacter freundii]